MTGKPEDDAFAEQLFEAARVERPRAAVKERARRNAAARERASQRARVFVLLAAALGVTLVLVVHRCVSEPTTRRLNPEPIATWTEPPYRRVEPQHPPAPEPAPPATQPAPSAAPVRSAAPKARPATLEDELSFLEVTRRALAAGDTRGALDGLARYDKLATERRLGTEATLLRIQTYARLGRTAEASAIAERFVRENPNSPLVDRARSFVVEPVSGP